MRYIAEEGNYMPMVFGFIFAALVGVILLFIVKVVTKQIRASKHPVGVALLDMFPVWHMALVVAIIMTVLFTVMPPNFIAEIFN